eukprot:scaffold25783_cov118-Isochrysis_galbana.AAC.5
MLIQDAQLGVWSRSCVHQKAYEPRETRAARGRLWVTCIRFDATECQRVLVGALRNKCRVQRASLDWIAQSCACAVGFHTRYIGRLQARVPECRSNEALLSLSIRSGQARALTILSHTAPKRGHTIGISLKPKSVDACAASLSTRIAISSCIERLACASRRRHARSCEGDAVGW